MKIKNKNGNKTKKFFSKLIDKTQNKNCIIKSNLKAFEGTIDSKKKGLVKSNEHLKQKFIKMLMTKFLDTKIKPNNDYYNYINSVWLKNVNLTKEQKYIVQIDDFRLVQDKVYRELDDIVSDYIKNNKNIFATNLNNFRNSVINMNSKEDTRKLAHETVLLVDELRKDKKNLWKLLGIISRDEMIASTAPLYWNLYPDEKEPTIFRSHIMSDRFFLTDLSVYNDDGTNIEYKKKYSKKYNDFNKKLFSTLLGKNNYNIDTDNVFIVAKDIFRAFYCTEIKDSQYNKVYADESLEKYNFDWKEFSKEIGYKTPPPFFITRNLNFLKCCSKLLLDEWNSEKWRAFWIWIFLKKLCRLTRDWEKIIYDFNGKMERGQENMIERKASVGTVLYMSLPFNTFLTNSYIAKYKNLQAIEYVKTLCEELRIVFLRILKRNSWMSTKTKNYAIYKLKKMKFVIGNLSILREDPLLDYGKNLYINMKKIIEWRHNQLIKLEGKPVIDIPFLDWTQYPVKLGGTQAYVVNAQYTPIKNEIFINLGYIQEPFIDLDERGIEYNLAYIGQTICHEMSHGFDDDGSKFGADGKLHDWWTEEDKKIFKKIQLDIIRQYEEWTARDGIKYDASIGIGESIADISGMAICDEYLKDFQENNDDLIPIQYYSFQAFYTYYAFRMKQKIGKQALTSQLKTNPHPLDKYRTNVPLSRSLIFRAIYDVEKGDKMWWHNSEVIW